MRVPYWDDRCPPVIDVRGNEQWYDEEVAPVLMRLAEKCALRYMNLLAMVGNTGEHYNTLMVVEGRDPAIRLAYMAIKSLGNIDALISGAIRDAEKHGGTDHSVYLTKILRAERARQAVVSG